MNIQSILPYVQLLVSCGTLIGMLYALKQFVDKPHDSLEQRVETLEQKVSKIETSSTSNSDNIDRVTTALTALVDFEIAYCINTHYDADGINDLMHAKKVLRGEVDC